jgi:hypothetical protein
MRGNTSGATAGLPGAAGIVRTDFSWRCPSAPASERGICEKQGKTEKTEFF